MAAMVRGIGHERVGASQVECMLCQDIITKESSSGFALLPCLHVICILCKDDILRLHHININQVMQEVSLAKHEFKCPECEESLHGVDSILVVQPKKYNEKGEEGEEQSKKCLIHRAMELNCYCVTCQCCVCQECIRNQGHQRHEFVSIVEALKLKMGALEGQKHELDNCMQLLDSFCLESTEMEVKLQQRLIVIANEIDAKFKTLIEDLSKAKHRQLSVWERIFGPFQQETSKEHQQTTQQLIFRVENLKEDASTEIQADLKTIQLQQKDLAMAKQNIRLLQDQIAAYSNLAHSHQQSLQSILLADFLLKRTSSLIERAVLFHCDVSDSVCFVSFPPSNMSLEHIKRFGKITRNECERDFQLISQPSLIVGSIGYENEQFLYVSAIVQLLNGDIVVSDHCSERLKVFSPQGTFLRSIPLKHFVYHMAVSRYGLLWVCAPWSRTVLCLQPDGTILRQLKTTAPAGVAALASGLVIVGSADGRIRAFSSDDVLQWTSTGDCFASPRDITAISGDEIAVCDYKNHRLQVLSTIDGHFIRHIGEGELVSPIAVKLIPHTNKMVITQDSSALIMDTTGHVIHRWGTRGSEPGQFDIAGAVAVLQDTRIAIADYNNHRIQIF